MQKTNPAAARAPLYFNFANDVLDRWAQFRPEALALWCVDAATGPSNGSLSADWPL